MFRFNPLNAELNPIRNLLALLGAHHILHYRAVGNRPWTSLLDIYHPDP